MKSTESREYTHRLQNLQEGPYSKWYRHCNPYGLHIRSIIKGPTLEVGCGIGRVLKFAPSQITGVDHNPYSVAACREKGLNAWEPDEFRKSHNEKSFSTLLTSHVLEHMPIVDGIELLKLYTRYLMPGGTVIAITPQEMGYQSDATHICFVDFKVLAETFKKAGLIIDRQYSFPFFRSFGKFYIYNEFVTIGHYPID